MSRQTDNKKYDLYLNAFERAVRKYKDTPDLGNRKDYVKQAIFYGVKAVNTKDKPKYLTREAAENNFQFGSIVKSMIGLLTPDEFIKIFPIRKEYDGNKWQTKDYFYTRDYINTLDPNKPIREQEDPLMFLWEYTNWDITLFNVNLMGYLSDLRRLEGYPSMAAEWAEMNGIETHTAHQDHKGNEFIIKDGKALKLRKPRPKHLKLIK